MLPELERWFVRTFEQTLPLITDDRLREDVRGFIGQEAMHAEAHQEVLEHLLAKGLAPLRTPGSPNGSSEGCSDTGRN